MNKISRGISTILIFVICFSFSVEATYLKVSKILNENDVFDGYTQDYPMFCQECVRNNGTCVSDSDGTYECKCPFGYIFNSEAFSCELRFVECESSMCNDRGKCFKNVDSNAFSCICNCTSFNFV